MSRMLELDGVWGSLTSDKPMSKEDIEAKTLRLMEQMTLEDKLHQISGDTPFISRETLQMIRMYNRKPIPGGDAPRLGIPAIRFSDGPRGVVMFHSTCFPVSMARGATWDVRLEEKIGDAMGVEARTQGANFIACVCINLLRHPAWGRAQETYGEEPHLLGELGAALVRGVQRHVMACAKHFAANSLENTRFKLDVRMSERTLREVYLPHFKRCVEEGVASIMSAYNKINGEHCGHNEHLLREILKEEWGFEGFVISDFWLGIRDGEAAIKGGLDLEMPFPIHYGRKFVKLVKKGKIPMELIDEAVFRILRQKIRFAQIGEPERYEEDAIACTRHQRLALEAAQKSMVLLKNEPSQNEEHPVLPLDRTVRQTVALIGRLASIENTGDRGSSAVRPPYSITPLKGLQELLGEEHVLYNDARQVESAVAAAKQADVAVVVVGYTHKEEGEYLWIYGGDRGSLTLRAQDESLIQAVVAANPKTIVVMVGGSAIVTESWRHSVPCILMSWYSGMEGGRALTDILFGRINPSGKLPCVFPKSAKQLPFFDRKAKTISYDGHFGGRYLEANQETPAFPFGFGMSYTTYTYDNLKLKADKLQRHATLEVEVEVTNAGSRVGDEIVQLYIGCEGSMIERPVKELKRFVRIPLIPGQTKTVSFSIPRQELAYYDEQRANWMVEPGRYRVYVGPSSVREDCLSVEFLVEE